MYRLLLITLLVTLLAPVCHSQTIALPDILFAVPTIAGDVAPHRPVQGVEMRDVLFEVAPAVTFEDYVTNPHRQESLFHEFPELPSEFYFHVLLLHLSKANVPGLQASMSRFKVMLDNFNRNLLQGGGYVTPYVQAIYSDTRGISMMGRSGSAGLVVSGTLDPLEAYRRWVQERRLMRARNIIRQLEELPAQYSAEPPLGKVVLPANLLEETDYDVKVKQDGNNPPYRP